MLPAILIAAAALITPGLQTLLPWLHKHSEPTAQDANPARDHRDKLRKNVREHRSKP